MGKKVLLISILLSLLIPPIIGYGQDLKTAPTVPIFGPDGVIEQITNILFSLLIFGAVISFIYAGFLFITAAGDPTKFDTAKKAVLYGVIGLLIAFSSWGIVNLIEKIAVGEMGEQVTSCSEYCRVQGKSGGNCAPECGLLWGQHWSGGDSFCHSIAPKCCCL